jgi:PAS domain S-box-containing protein
VTDAAPDRTVHRTIPWHQRLEARVLVAVTLIAFFSLAAVTIVTGRVVESQSLARASDDLSAARVAFTHLVAQRAESVRTQAKLITELPIFKAHMTDSQLSSDRETMQVMAETYRQQVHAAFCIVASGDGRRLASPGAQLSSESARAVDDVARAASGRQSARRILALDRGVFLIVAEPVRYADEVLGALVFGYHLDDAQAHELAQITRIQVAFLSNREISGSSLDGDARAALEDAVRTDAPAARLSAGVGRPRIGGADYVGGLFPLEQDAAPDRSGSLILLRELEPTRQFIDDIARRLLWAGAAVFLAALAGSIALGRRVSRPLREIADVAGEIAGGRWDRRVPVRGSAEAKVMADAFNDMTRSLSHWHAEARRRTEQVQAAYERYAAVTNSAHDAIVSADVTGAVVFWNRSAESIFGYGDVQALALPMPTLLAESSRAAFSRMLSEVVSAGESGPARTFDGEGLRRDGHQFPLELSLASWKADGAVYVTAIIRDVTERKRTQEALEQRDTQLRQAQKMEAIGRLASGVAHDFNNALAVIQGYTEQVMLCVGEGHEHYEDLHEVLKASQSAASLTRQLLAFSRKQALEPQVLSLAGVISNVRKMLQRLVGDGVDLVMHFDAHDDRVFADRGQIEQVIVNLCVNARDAMPEGGRVEVGVRRVRFDNPEVCTRLGVAAGEFVTLSVRDTGHGMSREVAAHIFEPFFTTKEEGKGTGLGLATVYGIVTQSGGAIELDTRPGRGTTFNLHLPAAAEACEPVERSHPDEAQGRGTVLLVEDEDPVRAILGKSLEASGYRVIEARSGAEALRVLRGKTAQVDVVLTDIVMPGMSGLVLSETVSTEWPGTPVLFMSGHAADAIARHGFDPTRARFLQKPFSTQTLCRELRGAMASPDVH